MNLAATFPTLRRFTSAVLVVWLVATIIFGLLEFSGNPLSLLISETATPDMIENTRHNLGLDKPLPLRYLKFLQNILQGDMGRSFYSGEPALNLLLSRLPATLALVSTAMLIAVFIGLPLGVLAATHQGRWQDKLVLSLSSFGVAAPTFFIGTLLIYFFAVRLRVLPSVGAGSLAHLVLPAITLAVGRIAMFARYIRTSLLEVLNQDFIRAARAKGLPERSIVYKHALRNALLPFITVAVLQFGGLLSGAVVTESLFAWPGMNRVALAGLQRLDYPIVLAFGFLVAVLFSALSFIADVLYGWVDPRVRFE